MESAREASGILGSTAQGDLGDRPVNEERVAQTVDSIPDYNDSSGADDKFILDDGFDLSTIALGDLLDCVRARHHH